MRAPRLRILLLAVNLIFCASEIPSHAQEDFKGGRPPSNPPVRRRVSLPKPQPTRQNVRPAAKRGARSQPTTAAQPEPTVDINEQVEAAIEKANNARHTNRIEAESQYRHAMSLAPNDWRPYYGLGNLYNDQDRYAEAVELYKQAARLNTNNPELFYYLGFSLNMLGLQTRLTSNLLEAIDAYQRAIRLQPDNAHLYQMLAGTYESLKRYADAAEARKQQIRLKPGDSSAYRDLGFAYTKLGRYEEALGMYHQALRIKPDDDFAHSLIGRLYAEQKRFNEAIKAYQEAINAETDDLGISSTMFLTEIYIEQRRHAEGIAYFKELARLRPNKRTVYQSLGKIYYNQGNFRDALEAYRQGIRVEPEADWIYYDLGLTYLKLGDKSGAMEQYQALKRMSSSSADSLLTEINKR